MFGSQYVRAFLESDNPEVVGSLIRFHTDTSTDTTITGFLAACKSTFQSPDQLVMSSQLSPRAANIGKRIAAARFAQNTGFLNRIFQLILMAIPPFRIYNNPTICWIVFVLVLIVWLVPVLIDTCKAAPKVTVSPDTEKPTVLIHILDSVA